MGIDPLFYELVGRARADDLAAAAHIPPPPRGHAICVSDLAPHARAGTGDLTYCTSDNPKHIKSLCASIAFVPLGCEHQTRRGVTALGAQHPARALAMAAHLLARPRRFERTSTNIHPSAHIENGVHIGPNVVIGQECSIGAGTVIDPGAVIGPGVSIGRASRIGAKAVISFALVGDDVSIHAGAVIGSGTPAWIDHTHRLPADSHWGRVIVQESASIGATSVVRRGFIGDTVIGLTAHIGNGCVIADDCMVDVGVVIDDGVVLSNSITVSPNQHAEEQYCQNRKNRAPQKEHQRFRT